MQSSMKWLIKEFRPRCWNGKRQKKRTKSGANLIEVQHVREGIYLHARETGIQIVLEIRGREHADQLLALAKEQGYDLNESKFY